MCHELTIRRRRVRVFLVVARRQEQRWNGADLATEIGVSRSTIYSDLQSLESRGFLRRSSRRWCSARPSKPDKNATGVARRALEPIEARLMSEIQDLHNRTGRPVPGSRLADFCAMPERTARFWLRKMEVAGYVHRPAGRCSGYALVS